MALQTFTAGQVLTAAQVTALQTNDYNQTVATKTASYTLVAADKGTRVVMNSASATTITVNTSLFSAGDTLFIQNIGAGVCTITAGTATVSTVGSLALGQYAGGTLYFTSTGVAVFFSYGLTETSWTTYTPTLSGTGWSLGNGTITGRYVRVGDIVCAELMFTFGSTSVAGSAVPTASLPVNANTTISPNPAQVTINDTSGPTTFIGQGSIGSTGVTANVGVSSGSYTSLTGLAAGVPMTWATGDEIRWTLTYEAA